MKPTATWVLVANSRRARVLETQGPALKYHNVYGRILIKDETGSAAPKPERRQDGSPFGKFAVMEFHALEQREASFARQLTDLLEAEYENGAFERVFIAAPPGMLAALHAAVRPKLRAAIVAEMDRDITHQSEEALQTTFGPLLAS